MPQTVQNCEVTFQHEMTYEDTILALQAVDTHLTTWRQDFGRHTRPIEIEVSGWLYLPVGSLRARGAYYAFERKIRVIVGQYYHVPALYHELCHYNMAPTDVRHEDERWLEWNARAAEVCAELRAKFFEAN